jgi:Ser/Thr protein kinase RdoA (MazF antagonist)
MNEQDVSTILQQYDIGSLRAAMPFDFPHRPWKISADAGDFVVRECFLNSRPEDLDFEHRLAWWLDARGFRVSQPVPARDGRTWCERNGRLFAVYSLIPGEHFLPGNATQAHSAGTALAKFHEVASAMDNVRNRRLPEGYRSATDNAAFLMKQHRDRAEIASLVSDFERLDGGLPPSLPEALLFNDFRPGNLLFAGDDFSGAFDLDCCFWGPRLLDVAMSLLAFTLSLEGEEGVPGTARFNLRCGRSWLAGYKGSCHLEGEEIRFLPLALRRQVRASALFDLADVAKQSKRWVQHEWDFSKLQIDLVDANCQCVIEGSTQQAPQADAS